MKRNCNFCGQILPDDALFCANCGRALGENVEVDTALMQPSSPQSGPQGEKMISGDERRPTHEDQMGGEEEEEHSLPFPPLPLASSGGGGTAPVVQGAMAVGSAPTVSGVVPSLKVGAASGVMKVMFALLAGLVVVGGIASVAFLLRPFSPPTNSGKPTPVLSLTQTAVAKTRNNTYAFVRNRQLWFVSNNGQPKQMTNFTYPIQMQGATDTTVYWSNPAWSEDDRYIAVIMANLGTGLGGMGCPSPSYSVGNLYIIDTQSKQITRVDALKAQIVLPGDSIGDSGWTWRYFAWEDATHVLLLSNYDSRVFTEGNIGFYRYDLTTHKVGQAFSANAQSLLGQANIDYSLLNVRYNKGQIYYQLVDHLEGDQRQVWIYSRSATQPSAPMRKVMQAGVIAWCTYNSNAAYSPFVYPGWDISPDGKHLAIQMVSGSGDQGRSVIQVLDLETGKKRDLFQQLPAGVRGNDLFLKWAPDNRTLLVESASFGKQIFSYYVSTLDKPEQIKTHTHASTGRFMFCNHPNWRPDSSELAISCNDQEAKTVNVYAFMPGEEQEHMIANGAETFNWG